MENASPNSTSARKVKFQDDEFRIEGVARKVLNIDGVPLLCQKTTHNNAENSQLGSQIRTEKQTENEDLLGSKNENKVVGKKSGPAIVSDVSYADSLQSGDRVAYPVVEYSMRLNWKKYGLQRSMMNANGFFFFKFADRKGMLDVLEGGPWLIRNRPIFLNPWSPTSPLRKEDIKKVAVWVKLHDIPLAAYSDDGLSMLASKIGSPRLLDSYTMSMCSDTWGRSSYARALIEISAEHDFKDELSIAILELEGDKYVTKNILVEYEWKPPRCAHCWVFWA